MKVGKRFQIITYFAIILVSLSVLVLVTCVVKPASPLPVSGVIETKGIPIQEAPEGLWERTLKSALKEGRVTVYSSDGSSVRASIVDAFKQKFGLEVEWTTGTPSELQRKVVTERKAGIYVPDIVMVGPTTLPFLLKDQGVFQRMNEYLMLSEVRDPNQWYQQKFPWFDEEHTTIGHSSQVFRFITINNLQVKAEEIAHLNELLDPRWKGKIIMNDPTLSGTGQTYIGMLGDFIMGWDFIARLAKQEPFIIRDYRLQVDWLAKGRYPLAMGARAEIINEYIRAGAPISYVNIPEAVYLSNGSAGISVLEKAPHLASARIYLNWFLSREGQTEYSKARGYHSMRNDVPTEHLDPNILRDPRIKYFNTSSPEALAQKDNWDRKTREIFGSLVGR